MIDIKIRIFKDDAESPNAEEAYFYATNSKRHPSRFDLEIFLRSAPFTYELRDYDSASGIGLIYLDWPSDISSGDLELSSCPEGGEALLLSVVADQGKGFSISLSAFFDLLESHDWFCHFAEDAEDYIAGINDLSTIIDIAKKGGSPFLRLMNDYRSYMFSGKRFGIVQLPKPDRPGGTLVGTALLPKSEIPTSIASRNFSGGHAISEIPLNKERLH